MKTILIIGSFLLAPILSYAQQAQTSVLSLDTSKYLSANNDADKELEFRLFVQPGHEDPKRNIDLRLLQNKIRNEYKEK